MSNCYGPQLPPNIKKQSEDTSKDTDIGSTTREPPVTNLGYIGPALPPGFKQCVNDETEPDNKDEKERVAKEDPSSQVIGPALPPGFKKPDFMSKDFEGKKEREDYESSDSDDDAVCGPLLPGSDAERKSRIQEQLEMRARAMRQHLSGKKTDDESSKAAARETWMLELPAGRSASLGLGPRSFRAKAGPDLSDRSSWTDTPEDKKRKEELSRMGISEEKVDLEAESRRVANDARDKFMEEELSKSKKKRKEKSLLEEHQKKLRKKAKKDKKKRKGEPEERRPFSREVDLQVNRFDEAQKKSIIKKAGQLNDRFSRGETKFL